MHPTHVGEFVQQGVAALRSRVAARPDLEVDSIDLDLDNLEVFIAFHHVDYEMRRVTTALGLWLPGNRLHRVTRLEPVPNTRRIRTLVLRLGLDRYDFLPPTADLLDERHDPLPGEEWPRSFDGRGIVQHREYSRPFFCRPGFREYHAHQQHEDEPWAKWRELRRIEVTVVELLDHLRNRWYGAA